MEPSVDRARKVAEEAITRLAADLDAGKSEALTAYLAAASRFHRYSWSNVLLIATQRPSASRVAGIHAWNDLGRTVKKGEKGIAIFAPIVRKRDTATPTNPKEPENDIPRLTGFRTAYVFDVAQTEGKPLPQFAQTGGDPGQFLDQLQNFARDRGIAIEYDPSIAPALGVSTGGRIRLIPDLPKGEEFAVLAHEIAHEMLHHRKDVERLPKVVRETQAEAVAFVVSHAVGLETNHAAADYITLYNGDKKTLTESLQTIQATASQILNKILPEPEHARSSEERVATPATLESGESRLQAEEHPSPTR